MIGFTHHTPHPVIYIPLLAYLIDIVTMCDANVMVSIIFALVTLYYTFWGSTTGISSSSFHKSLKLPLVVIVLETTQQNF